MQVPRTARDHMARDETRATALALASQAGPASPLSRRHSARSRSPSPSRRVRPTLSSASHTSSAGFDPFYQPGFDSQLDGFDDADDQDVQDATVEDDDQAAPLSPPTPIDRPLTPFADDAPTDATETLDIGAFASAHVHDGVPTNIVPSPNVLAQIAALPPFVHQFVHHDLSQAERMMYTNAAVSSVSGSDHASVSSTLAFSNRFHQASSGQAIPTPTSDPFEAYSRLGVNPDPLIRRYAVCDKEACCHLIPLPELKAYDDTLGHQDPTGDACEGSMFHDQDKRKGPARILAFTPLSTTLQIFFRDPRFVSNLQTWRGDGSDDVIGLHSSHSDGSEAYKTTHQWTSVYDGTAWRSREAFRTRTVDENGVRETNGGNSQRLVSLEFGLLASVNIDW